jgi:hypothetical protein
MPPKSTFVAREKLLRSLGGNFSAAERLVQNLQNRFPGREAVWYWEKALYDLERDRH